jgi:hypothetical protein
MYKNCTNIIIIKTYLPIKPDHINIGIFDKVTIQKCCPQLNLITDLIKRSSPIGKVGFYEGVFEINLGFEGFTPVLGSHSTLGKVGDDVLTPSLQLTTYASEQIEKTKLETFLMTLEEIHPWEHPIIELSYTGSTTLFRSKKNVGN